MRARNLAGSLLRLATDEHPIWVLSVISDDRYLDGTVDELLPSLSTAVSL
jgi:hypothetical protein